MYYYACTEESSPNRAFDSLRWLPSDARDGSRLQPATAAALLRESRTVIPHRICLNPGGSPCQTASWLSAALW